jgi:hypothetical protein
MHKNKGDEPDGDEDEGNNDVHNLKFEQHNSKI